MTLVLLSGLSAGVLQDAHGNVIAGRQVNVYARGTSTPVQVYSDSAGSSPMTQPLTTDSSGQVPGYVAGGVSIDIVDALTGLREQAEPVTAGVLATAFSYGAKGGGTVDTTAVQTGVNAISAAGGGTLILPAGYTFKLGSMTPASNVTIWAYGATIVLDTSTTHAIWYYTSLTPLSNFTLRGGTFAGTGSETQNQSILQLFGGVGTDINVYDTVVTNWATGPYYLGNCARARAVNNTFVSCGFSFGTNLINFVDQVVGNDVVQCVATGNVSFDARVASIAYGSTLNTTGGDRKILIANNTIQNNAVANAGIDVELAAASVGPGSKFTITGNEVTHNGTTSQTYGIDINGSSGIDPLQASQIIVQGNTVDATVASGIRLKGSYISASGNIISAQQTCIRAGREETIAVTGTTANASNQITGASTPTGLYNGMPISGTNIVSGTFIQSGAGTATITMSANATGANSGITAYVQSSGLNIGPNIIKPYVSPTSDVLFCSQIRDSKVSGNVITLPTGSTTANNGISFTRSSWVDIEHNHVLRSAKHGIIFQLGNDAEINNNDVHNADESATGFSDGIIVANVTGSKLRILDNTVIDDRASPNTFDGIGISTNTNALAEVRGNRISGFTNAPIDGTPQVATDNTFTTGARNGRAVLVAGTVTVSTAEIRASDSVILNRVVAGGTVGVIQLGTIVAGTSFVINSVQPGTASTLQASDTSTVYWKIDH